MVRQLQHDSSKEPTGTVRVYAGLENDTDVFVSDQQDDSEDTSNASHGASNLQPSGPQHLAILLDEQTPGCDILDSLFFRSPDRDYLHFSEDELGDHDSISIDVSEYTFSNDHLMRESDKKLVVEENREALLGFVHDVIARCSSDQELVKFQQKRLRLRKACWRVSLTPCWVPPHIQRSLLGLAVYERLLYGKPIKLVAKSVEEQLGLRYAGKGGYVVTGEFVKGEGQRSVYLSSHEFGPDADLFLDMRNEFSDHSVFQVSVKHLVKFMGRVSQENKEWKCTEGKEQMDFLRLQGVQYNSNPAAALMDHALENESWIRYEHSCLKLAALQCAIYGKPIPLLCPAAPDVFVPGVSKDKHAAYVKLIREVINRVSS